MNVDQLCVPFKQEKLMLNSSGLKSIELPIFLKDGSTFPSFKRFYLYAQGIYQVLLLFSLDGSTKAKGGR